MHAAVGAATTHATVLAPIGVAAAGRASTGVAAAADVAFATRRDRAQVCISRIGPRERDLAIPPVAVALVTLAATGCRP